MHHRTYPVGYWVSLAPIKSENPANYITVDTSLLLTHTRVDTNQCFETKIKKPNDTTCVLQYVLEY